jgi:hypothetical protein
MPRPRKTDGWDCEWLCCLGCGTRWVGGTGPASRVCVGHEDEGCGSRRVVREVTATRIFRRRKRREVSADA